MNLIKITTYLFNLVFYARSLKRSVTFLTISVAHKTVWMTEWKSWHMLCLCFYITDGETLNAKL